MSAEVQAVAAAQGSAAGATAYLNLESGDCHGEDAAVRALLGAGLARVVLGTRHPLAHMRGSAIRALRGSGVSVGGCAPGRPAGWLPACLLALVHARTCTQHLQDPHHPHPMAADEASSQR